MPSIKRKRVPQNPHSARSIRRRMASSMVTASANKIPRTLREFPSQMRVKLRYCAVFQAPISATAAGAAPGYVASFRANSVFDPDAAIGGVAATGFSQWSTFYQKYLVVGSKMSMRVMDQDTGTSTGGTVNGLWGITLRDSALPIVPPTVIALVTDSDAVHGGWDSFHANQKISKSVSVAKYFGVENILDNNELAGSTGTTLGSNPGREIFYYMWLTQAPAAGAVAQATQVEVFIEYDVIFSTPADLA